MRKIRVKDALKLEQQIADGCEQIKEICEAAAKKCQTLEIYSGVFRVIDDDSKQVNNETSSIRELFGWFGKKLTKDELISVDLCFRIMSNDSIADQI